MTTSTKIIAKLKSFLNSLNQLEPRFSERDSITDKLIDDINKEFTDKDSKFLCSIFNEIFTRCIGNDCLKTEHGSVFVAKPLSELPFPIYVYFEEQWNEKTEQERLYIRDSSSTGRLHPSCIKLKGGYECKKFFENIIISFPQFTKYIQGLWCLEIDPEQRGNVWNSDSSLQYSVCIEALQQKHFYLDFDKLESISSDERNTTMEEISKIFENGLRNSNRHQSYIDIMEITFQLLGYPCSNSNNITKNDFYLKGLVYHEERINQERSARWDFFFLLGKWNEDPGLRLRTYHEVFQFAYPFVPFDKLPVTIDREVKDQINYHVKTNIEKDKFFDLNKLLQIEYYKNLRKKFEYIDYALVYHFKRIAEDRAIRWTNRLQ